MIKQFCKSLPVTSSFLGIFNITPSKLLKSLDHFLSGYFSLNYLNIISNYRSYNGSVFGVKLQSRDTHLAKKLSSMHWHPILLYRSNIIRVVASFHYSRCTGCWDERLIYSYNDFSLDQLFDPLAIKNSIFKMNSYTTSYRSLLSFFSRYSINYTMISFDDLIKECSSNILDQVASALDLHVAHQLVFLLFSYLISV